MLNDSQKHPYIEIMDCTLRDGEQTSGVSFLPHEKLMIARQLLKKVNVDRLEVASARVSEGEKEAVSKICRIAEAEGMLGRIEVLGFVDGKQSVDWIRDCGGRVINLLAKGSYRHCMQQLHKQPQEHLDEVMHVIDYAYNRQMTVNLYLEDWSGGMRDSPDYVFWMMDALKDMPVRRFLLPDTLGIINPLQVVEYIRKMLRRYPGKHFDFHAHNDYDLAVSNTLAAVLSGCRGVHVTVNGLGERCGNAPLASVQAILKDQFHARTSIDESQLNAVSRLVEGYSGIAVAPNMPIVGENVFTQVAGVHADGDNKNNLYCNELIPERFGRKREYALGKNSGKANIIQNLKELGLLSYMVSTSYGLKPIASIKVEIDGEIYEADSTGDGQYDAFVKALRKIYKEKLNATFPRLANYVVSIPPGGHTDALVQTVITWNVADGKLMRTHGLDVDQTEAAIKATFKMLNIIHQQS